jgi:hypothetical protein
MYYQQGLLEKKVSFQEWPLVSAGMTILTSFFLSGIFTRILQESAKKEGVFCNIPARGPEVGFLGLKPLPLPSPPPPPPLLLLLLLLLLDIQPPPFELDRDDSSLELIGGGREGVSETLRGEGMPPLGEGRAIRGGGRPGTGGVMGGGRDLLSGSRCEDREEGGLPEGIMASEEGGQGEK